MRCIACVWEKTLMLPFATYDDHVCWQCPACPLPDDREHCCHDGADS